MKLKHCYGVSILSLALVGNAAARAQNIPAPPARVRAMPAGNSIQVTWAAAIGMKYSIYRTDSGTPRKRLAENVVSGMYTDTAVLPGAYVYEIVATDTNGYSSIVSAPANATVTTAPALAANPTLVTPGQAPQPAQSSSATAAPAQPVPDAGPPPGLMPTISPSQQSTCDAHGMSVAQCILLVKEFDSVKALQVVPFAGSGSLDQEYSDIATVVSSLTVRAYAKVLEGQLKDKALQEAQQVASLIGAQTQVGGSSSAAGSTSLVSRPTTTDFLSMAAESGAFTDTQNGNAVTLQANANGLLKYVSNKPAFLRWESKWADPLQHLNFAVSVNVAQSSTSTAPVSGSANATTLSGLASVLVPANNTSFSSFSASYNLYTPFNPQKDTFRNAWNAQLQTQQAALAAAGLDTATAVTALLQPIVFNPPPPLAAARGTWWDQGRRCEVAGNFDGFVSAYANYYAALKTYLVSTGDLATQVRTVNAAIAAYQAIAQQALTAVRGAPLATVTYTYATPAMMPPTHQGTLVTAYLFKGKVDDATGKGSFLAGAQLTGNFTASVYSSVPAGAVYGSLRDVQLSSEFDKPFGGTVAAPRGTWSLAGYGQYQYSPTVLDITAGNLAPGTNITLPSDAQVLLGTAGWLGVVQGKVVINLSKGLTLPVAIKWSNKTDLLPNSDVRGQFGLSYDLSALSSLIR